MKRIFYILLIFFVGIPKCFSQDITFNHLTTDDGLSQISVNSLYKDERGSIWIGTRDGLCRYNGNDIKTFKLRKNDPNSLFCNNVLRIAGDQNGKIYLLCTEGMAVFDLEMEKFTTLLQENISAIYYDEELYIGKKNKIYTYNETSKKLTLIYELPSQKSTVSCIYMDSKGTFWIGTANDGLYTFNPTLSSKSSHLIAKGNITSIYQDSSNDVWIGSWEHGLFRFKDNVVFNYRNDPKDSNSICSNFVRACCEDNLGNIWIGTFHGLNKYNKKTRQFSVYTADNSKSDSPTHSSIWCIIKDHQGTMWLGTYFGGVNYFNPEYEIYTQYKASNNERNGLSSPVVGKMIEDKYKNLWICTEGGGLNMYNRKTKTFKWYKHSYSNANSLSHDNIKSIYYDSDKEIMWIGTHLGGLNRLDLRTDKFTRYLPKENDANSLPSDIIRDIVPYKDNLILATEIGVCMFNPQTGKFKLLFKDINKGYSIPRVSDLFFDSKGTLWMATTGEGAYSYRFDSNKLVNYKHNSANPQSISNNNIYSIAQDHHGHLWFCTSGSGLDLYRYDSNDFENFDSQNNGLSSDCVYEVCESRYGKLLVITNQGFSQFDYSNKSFYNHNKENGFPLTAINENAMFLTSDGEVFLGGVKGMISFYERDLRFAPKPYSISLYRLIVNGKEVTVDDDTNILHRSLANSKEITLKSSYSIFSIEFATSNFIPENKDEVLYRLEGFSDEWTSTRGQHIITYTNLNPGKYVLVIRSNAKDETLSRETRLSIIILPPFYKTTYAYLLYLIIILLLSYYLAKTYNSRIKLQESLKYEQKHNQDIEELNQSKLRFFTNISHEFRTPLTLIIGQIEMLLQVQSFTPSIYNKILGVYKNSLQLKELISELLDFRKQEQGHMKIKVSKHNIVSFLYENSILFLEYASARQTNFKFNKTDDIIDVWYDSKQMQKVINNLLSNAFKHTKEGDTISIDIKKEDDYAIFKVKDTGTGINPEDIDKIFNRFYQTEKMDSFINAGTGIGLALTKGIVELHHGTIEVSSEVGKGTAFTVRLKLGKNHFDDSQLSDEEEVSKQTVEIEKPALDFVLEQEMENGTNTKIKDEKMLIVEDNDSLREMLSRIFSTFYNVITAADGEEGLEKVKSEAPNIVLSDVVMPKMSGTDLCKLIKNDIETCHIPVVLLTARTAIEHNLEGLRIGADDYITKPFNINILISRCNNLVNSRILLQEKFSNQPQTAPQMLATNALDKEILDKAMTIIDKYLDNTEFNVNLFAREMGMARTNLFAKIKAITGQTPNDFISNIRLKKAAFMLRNNPELNISEISDRIGFNSSRYFSKCFKDQYHISPLSYRKGLSSDDENEEKNEE
ncbi:MAG: two-component regulator propeller domain-containing protein [Bacteroidaceae bacterium]